MVRAFAQLAEKLTQRRLDEDERRNPNLVIALLKQGLEKRKGRCLLCLDNADENKECGLLNEVCKIPVGIQKTGWVVVTSRQGQPHIWNEMICEQRLVLEPLSAEDAMVALWRHIRKIKSDVEDDNEVLNAIKKLENRNAEEYQALKELCRDEGEFSLGGLPLALVQAGACIAQFKCSVSEYLRMFKNANRIEKLLDIMRSTEDVKPIQESQRSVRTTWKISVWKLSEKAYCIWHYELWQ